MNDYPVKVYFSVSWRGDNLALDKLIACNVIKHNISLVQDHLENKNKDGNWIQRIHLFMRDCHGLVSVFPYRKDSIQTTSPYMFPEILTAVFYDIPIIIFYHRGVKINRNGNELIFGESDGKTFDLNKYFHIEDLNINDIDSDLTEITRIVLKSSSIIYLQEIPEEKPKVTERLIEDFINDVSKIHKPDKPFVMNIIPFLGKDTIHPAIASGIFKATGLECKISLDSQGCDLEQRAKWKQMIDNAEFFVSELSQLRDNCLYETGLAQGTGKNVIILSKQNPSNFPYGLDNEKFIRVYKNYDSIEREVEIASGLIYRRKIYNFDESIQNDFNNKVPGIPTWINSLKSLDYGWKLTVSIAFISVATTILMISIFKIFSSLKTEQLLLSLVPVTLSIFGNIRSSREWIEKKFKNSLYLFPKISFCYLFASLALFIYSLVK